MTTPYQEILDNYMRMGTSLARANKFKPGTWEALSQYGYCLADGFSDQQSAEQYAIDYYAQRMNLIRQ